MGNDHHFAFLAALGELVVASNYLEEALIDLAWVGTNMSEFELFEAVRGKTMGALIHQVLPLVEPRVGRIGLVAEFEALASPLELALRNRNEFIHASWVFAGKGVERSRIPKSGIVREELRRLKHTDVEAATLTIDAARDLVEDLFDEVVKRLPNDAIAQRGGTVDAAGVYRPSKAKPSVDP